MSFVRILKKYFPAFNFDPSTKPVAILTGQSTGLPYKSSNETSFKTPSKPIVKRPSFDGFG